MQMFPLGPNNMSASLGFNDENEFGYFHESDGEKYTEENSQQPTGDPAQKNCVASCCCQETLREME